LAPNTTSIRPFIFGLITLIAAFVACYPYPNPIIADFDTVVTVRTEGATFEGFTTYAIPDTVFEKPVAGSISQATKDFLLSEVHRNMQELGYQLEADPEQNPPDVAVIVSIITEDRYGSWAGYGWGGWYGGGGALWVTHPPVSVRYLYTEGSVSLDMVDYANIDVDEGVFPVLWAAAITGPLQSDVDNQRQRVQDGINKAFDQSPYLKPN
jgi:hypothetical protein